MKNSKTPVALSLNLMNRLTESDVKKLSTDRNVPEALRLAARKQVAAARRSSWAHSDRICDRPSM